MPSWNVADLLEGRVRMPDGSYRGTPMAGEIEHAILAQVPTERIRAIHKVGVATSGALEVKRMVPNPNFKRLGGP